MIRLDATTRKLQVVLGGAVTANQLPVVVSYSDKTSTAYTGATQVANTNSSTAVDICAAPAASTVRDVDFISVRNSDTAAATVTIRYNDNGTTYVIVTKTLAVGDSMSYTHAHGWEVMDASGNLKTASTSSGSLIVDDTSTNATMYPTWVTAASGTLPLKVSSTGLTWNPGTGALSISGDFTQTLSVNGALTNTISNTNTGSLAQAYFYAQSDAGGVFMKKASTAAGAYSLVGSSGGTFSVGTTDAQAVELQTNNVTALTVDTSQNIGIASGNLTFAGTGQRITGDFSNATLANQVAIQTSTTNGATTLQMLPNGTSVTTALYLNGAADPTNASWSAMSMSGNVMYLAAGKNGTGTYPPMAFFTGGAERMRIDTSGNVTQSTNVNGSLKNTISNTNAGASTETDLYVTSNAGSVRVQKTSTATEAGAGGLISTGGTLKLVTSDAYPISLKTNGVSALTIDTSQNVLVTGPGGLGYGAGSGGTVTQATSKATAVTLNKTNGQITMNNAALAANTAVNFTFTNSTVTSTDAIVWAVKDGTGTAGAYLIQSTSGAGAHVVTVRNLTAGALSEAIVLNFAVIKAVTA
jgi:hypothetical protein